ncbi:MAG: hypothetical protein Q9166_002377 [cf. Caloplaca sp. 2 TL-2023]
MRNVNSPLQTPKNAPSQSDSNTVKGNFMSPTMASTKKANAPSTSREETRSATPSSIKLEKASTAKWMTFAAKRVGLRRVGGDGTPRSKKEGLKVPHNALTFPDKLSTPSHTKMPDSPRPKVTPASSLSDKPLPSPPIAQVMTNAIEEPRSLIDAREKPLRRTSPKSPQKQEEWPVLFPEKPTAPDAIRQALHQTTPEPIRSISIGQERYPRLSGSQSADTTLDQEPVTRLPLIVQIQRKQMSTDSLREQNAIPSAVNGPKNDAVNPTAQKRAKHSELFPRESRNSHRLSAGAAAVEKASAEAKSIKEPRQTRTSSLRARISAGQVIKDSPNKVLGFTDFTAESVPSRKTNKEDMWATTDLPVRPSSSVAKAFTKKPSKEFLGGTRAPAQFVAGSRRPAARRPSSRNSLRSESRASSPTLLEPSRPAPPVPTVKTDAANRKSSIPIFRNIVSTTMEQANSNGLPIEISKSAQHLKTDDATRNNFEIFEGRPNTSTTDTGSIAVGGAGSSDQTAVLEAIEESPRSTFRSKRISSNSPTFGPMLKISSSADRLILGTEDTNKENRPLAKKRSKGLFRAAVTNEHRNVTKGRTTSIYEMKYSIGRPLSSQGFPENRQDNDTAAGVPRAKKVKSIDLSNVISVKAEPNAKIGDEIVEKRTSSATDTSFFDAIEQPNSQPEGAEEQMNAVRANETSYSANPAPFISPVKDSAVPISDATPVVPAYLPETLQEHVHKSNGTPEITRFDEVKERNGGNGDLRINTITQRTTEQSAPSTPQQKPESNMETPSSVFPPRSSSRMQHPDYTVNRSAKNSPTSSLEGAAVRLEKELSISELAKPKISEADSFSLPIDMGANTSRQEISSQTILADVASKRDSTARNSHRSQVSVSKGLMSNFRGLFHKRTSDASETTDLRSNKKGSKRPTVNSHGSPFPSMSNIHPVHRPTQASLNRTNANSHANAQRTSGHSLLSTAPGTPALNSPIPTEISTTTSLAMQILESARKESSSPKKERLLSLGKIMVDCITQARDAEKAMEEAKQAARKAEIAHALCKKTVGDVANMIQEWKVVL